VSQSAVIASAICPPATLSGLNGDRSLGTKEPEVVNLYGAEME